MQRADVLVEKSLSGSYDEGRITCRFLRRKYPRRNDDRSYPLDSNTEYFVLLARGPSMGGIDNVPLFITLFHSFKQLKQKDNCCIG